MENNSLSKRTVGYGLALALACVINALLVVFKEKSDTVMAGMKRLTGHHWITHSVVIIALFLGLGWALAQARGRRGIAMTAKGLIGAIVTGVTVAGLIIVGFYLFAD